MEWSFDQAFEPDNIVDREAIVRRTGVRLFERHKLSNRPWYTLAGEESQDLLASVDHLLDSDEELSGVFDGLVGRQREHFAALRLAFEARHRDGQSDDALSKGINELRKIQIQKVEEEEERTREIARIRAQLAVKRVVASDADGRRDRKKKEADVRTLETELASRIEALQQFRRTIADVIVEKKRLEGEAGRLARGVVKRIVQDSKEFSSCASELEGACAALAEGLYERALGSEDVVVLAAALGAAEEPVVSLEVEEVNFARSDHVVDVAPGRSDVPHWDGLGGFESGIEGALESRALRAKHAAAVLTMRYGYAIGLVFVVAVFGAGFAALVGRDYGVIVGAYVVLAVVLLLAVAGQLRRRAAAADEDRVDAQNELDLLRIESHEPERRAQKMLQVNQLDLRRYYEQILGQGRFVFYLGIACLMLGFVVIACALVLVRETDDLAIQIATAGLGAIASIAINFVGVVYLKMFSGITRSVGAFHNRLVGTHDLYFGAFLASKIDSEALRQSAYSSLALEVAKRHAPSSKDELVVDDAAD